MKETGKIRTLLVMPIITYSLLKMLGSLLTAWLTLSWNVRKARKAFEAELRKEGISKEDAERLSKYFAELKDQMMSAAKEAIRQGRKNKATQSSPRIHINS